MIQKDFSRWFALKPVLDKKDSRKLFFKEREIWWCSVGINIGDEEDGKNHLAERPVLILKQFNTQIFWGLPMTSRIKRNKYHCVTKYKGYFYALILSQIRLWDKKRLSRKIRVLPQNEFQDIKRKLQLFLD